MMGLLALALIQVPSILRWWKENSAIWAEITGGQLGDPLGFNLAIAVILLINPFIAFLTVVCFAATSIQVVMVHARSTRAVLIAALFLQGGLVLGGYLVAGGLIAAAQALLAAGPPSSETDRFAAWIASEQNAASGVTFWLSVLFGGYLVSLIVSPGPAEARNEFSQRDAGPHVHKEAVLHGQGETGIERVFSESLYSVKPRGSWVHAWLGLKYPEYEIRSVPPSRESDFVFSWASSELRRAPDGPVAQGAGRGLNRAVAIALGPLLEAQGRRIAYRISA
jgi:hypothetical protein